VIYVIELINDKQTLLNVECDTGTVLLRLTNRESEKRKGQGLLHREVQEALTNIYACAKTIGQS
jgi:hypothetical protein